MMAAKIDASRKSCDLKNSKFFIVMVKGPTKNIYASFWSFNIIPSISVCRPHTLVDQKV